MIEEIASESLKDVKHIFDGHGVIFWLDSGTLLGAVRDGKMIEGDTDIDLGTWYHNLEKIISAFTELKEKRFNIVLNKKWS